MYKICPRTLLEQLIQYLKAYEDGWVTRGREICGSYIPLDDAHELQNLPVSEILANLYVIISFVEMASKAFWVNTNSINDASVYSH